MNIDPNLLIAAQLIHDECVNNSFSCVGCQLQDICEHTSIPDEWRIPEPPPEPTERPRIEWMRMLPDKEMVSVCAQRCDVCKYENRHGVCEMFDCYDGMSEWWHNAVTLEQFRKDVGLSNDTDS